MAIKKTIYLIASVTASLIIITITMLAFGAGSDNRDIFAKVYKGDSKNYRFTIKDEYNYQVVDLTDYTVKFRVKKNESDSSFVIDKSCTVSTPTSGQAVVTLSITDTNIAAGTYYAYLVLTNTGGTVNETLLKSKWIVVQ